MTIDGWRFFGKGNDVLFSNSDDDDNSKDNTNFIVEAQMHAKIKLLQAENDDLRKELAAAAAEIERLKKEVAASNKILTE